METITYQARRAQLEQYFDRTASQAWAKLTSDGPVSRIRATVRAGRDAMRATLLSFLPDDLRGCRVLDAGCGTGALAFEAAKRGAEVVAIDISATLVGLAQERTPKVIGGGSLKFLVSDMLEPSLGRFDYIVAMDSLIHYQAPDMAEMIARLASRADRGLAFTFAPSTPLLELKRWVGKLFPRSDRSPDIEPIRPTSLQKRIAEHPSMGGFQVGRTQRISTTFYISQALELVRT